MPATTEVRPTLSRREALFLAGGALAAAAVPAVPPTAPASAGWRTVDPLAEQLIADRLSPGLSLSVMRDGRIVRSLGVGLANIETGTPVTPESVFHVGSITKQFTGAAIALLAEDGKLSVDDKLARFLPLFPRAGEISLRQMLTHTSGLGNYTNMASPEAFAQAARADYGNEALLAAMAATNPLYTSEPGTAWAYSNTAYVLLGLVVQIAAQESYANFYKRRLFDPAGLTHTAVDNASEIVIGRTSGYTFDAKSPRGFANASFISMTFPHGAGSIRSTADDLCRWHDALLGGRVLKQASFEQMATPGHLSNGNLPDMPPAIAAVAGTDAKSIEYGFGIQMGSFEGRRFVEHNGGINGFLSALRSFPAEKVSVAVLVNTDSFAKPEDAKRVFAVRDAAAQAALAHG